jgi:glycine betaine/proline transport system ATP-binding protein
MQQRVGLARALATDADILLMDEAFSALDPLTRGEMQDELLRLQKELHKTIVFISHDMQEGLKLGDRIAVMKDGAIVQLGTPEELVTNPKNDYIKAFTEEVNSAQVITVGSVISKRASLRIGQDSVSSGLKQMSNHNLEVLYIVDEYNKPVGLVKRQYLEESLKQGKEDIMARMETNFPTVDSSTRLEDIFDLYKQGFPLVVVNDKKEFQGMVEAVDVLTTLGQPN